MTKLSVLRSLMAVYRGSSCSDFLFSDLRSVERLGIPNFTLKNVLKNHSITRSRSVEVAQYSTIIALIECKLTAADVKTSVP